jgi:hypothetical protein
MKEEFILSSSPFLFKEFNLSNPSLEKIIKAPIVDFLPHVPVMRMWINFHLSKELSHSISPIQQKA